jgi:hypothetical protein
MTNWKGLGRSGRDPILRFYPGIRLNGMNKATKNFSQDGRSPGQDLNVESCEYVAGVNQSTTTFGNIDHISNI